MTTGTGREQGLLFRNGLPVNHSIETPVNSILPVQVLGQLARSRDDAVPHTAKGAEGAKMGSSHRARAFPLTMWRHFKVWLELGRKKQFGEGARRVDPPDIELKAATR